MRSGANCSVPGDSAASPISIAPRRRWSTCPLPRRRCCRRPTSGRRLASFTSDIQPGDHYFLQTATQPLRGTLSIQLDTADAPGVDAACGPYNLAPFAICTVSPDVCTMFCTIPAPALANVGVAVTRSSWYVITLASLSFRLSTLSGQTLLANGPISPGGQAVVDFGIFLTLTWDGVAWHVQPAFGPSSDALFQRLTSFWARRPRP
jgi:hypothetical protein